jgi:hypothetical protein
LFAPKRAAAKPEKPIDRCSACIPGGNMAEYYWTINGAVYPNRNSLDVKEGERVEIVFRNHKETE